MARVKITEDSAPWMSSREALADASGLTWTGLGFTGDLTVHAARGAIGDLVENSDVVLSQAGTATIQSIGLGRPVISFIRPGDRMRRHDDESRLFGESRLLVRNEAGEIASALTALLQDDADRARRGAIGRVVHRGRQVATSEATLVGHDGRLYAHASTTCLLFDLPPASP